LRNYKDISNPLSRKKNPENPFDSNPTLSELLNGMFPPKMFNIDGIDYISYVSTSETVRDELLELENELNILNDTNNSLRIKIMQLEDEVSTAHQVNYTLRSMMSFMEVCKSGTLQVYDKSKGKFQPRWLFIRGHILHFYKDENDTSKPLGTIDITGSRVYPIPTTEDPKVREMECVFELITGQNVITLLASSTSDKKSWCDAFTHAKSVALARKENEAT